MPVLTILSLVGNTRYHLILLVEEAELRAQAKIADTQEADLFEHVFTG